MYKMENFTGGIRVEQGHRKSGLCQARSLTLRRRQMTSPVPTRKLQTDRRFQSWERLKLQTGQALVLVGFSSSDCVGAYCSSLTQLNDAIWLSVPGKGLTSCDTRFGVRLIFVFENKEESAGEIYTLTISVTYVPKNCHISASVEVTQ